jgi:hypothetical protein
VVEGRAPGQPGWLSGATTVRGRVLAGAGLSLPVIDPGQAVVVHLKAT